MQPRTGHLVLAKPERLHPASLRKRVTNKIAFPKCTVAETIDLPFV